MNEGESETKERGREQDKRTAGQTAGRLFLLIGGQGLARQAESSKEEDQKGDVCTSGCDRTGQQIMTSPLYLCVYECVRQRQRPKKTFTVKKKTLWNFF